VPTPASPTASRATSDPAPYGGPGPEPTACAARRADACRVPARLLAAKAPAGARRDPRLRQPDRAGRPRRPGLRPRRQQPPGARQRGGQRLGGGIRPVRRGPLRAPAGTGLDPAGQRRGALLAGRRCLPRAVRLCAALAPRRPDDLLRRPRRFGRPACRCLRRVPVPGVRAAPLADPDHPRAAGLPRRPAARYPARIRGHGQLDAGTRRPALPATQPAALWPVAGRPVHDVVGRLPRPGDPRHPDRVSRRARQRDRRRGSL